MLSDDGRHVVIHPLAYVREDDIAAYAEAKGFRSFLQPPAARREPQRKQVGSMMRQWWR